MPCSCCVSPRLGLDRLHQYNTAIASASRFLPQPPESASRQMPKTFSHQYPAHKRPKNKSQSSVSHSCVQQLYMTTSTAATIKRKLSHSPTQDDRFRALDRTLARRYVLRILQERQITEERRLQQGSLVYKPRAEICDDPSSSRITASLELPGMKAEDVRVHLEKDDVLLVSGERRPKTPSDQEGNVTYPVREIKYGKFQRVLKVPGGTMMSTISAAMNDGLLVISWPRVPPCATAPPAADDSSS